jgi:hypothetical protein
MAEHLLSHPGRGSFLPETLRSIVGDGSLPKPWYNRRPQESFKLREEAKHRFGKGILPPVEVEKLQRKKVRIRGLTHSRNTD